MNPAFFIFKNQKVESKNNIVYKIIKTFKLHTQQLITVTIIKQA